MRVWICISLGLLLTVPASAADAARENGSHLENAATGHSTAAEAADVSVAATDSACRWGSHLGGGIGGGGWDTGDGDSWGKVESIHWGWTTTRTKVNVRGIRCPRVLCARIRKRTLSPAERTGRALRPRDGETLRRNTVLSRGARVVIEKWADGASERLARYRKSGRTLPRVIISVRHNNGTPVKLLLRNVRVRRLAARRQNERMTEKIELATEKVERVMD